MFKLKILGLMLFHAIPVVIAVVFISKAKYAEAAAFASLMVLCIVAPPALKKDLDDLLAAEIARIDKGADESRDKP